jgi:hypothetical protein
MEDWADPKVEVEAILALKEAVGLSSKVVELVEEAGFLT